MGISLGKQQGRKKTISLVLAVCMILAMFGGVVIGEEDDDEGISRMAGINRFDTAAKVALDNYDSSDTVIIARGDDAGDFADGLASSVLAGALDAPILLTMPDNLREEAAGAIEELGASEAIILGGEIAVSAEVEEDLENMELEVERIAGESRFETATEIAEDLRVKEQIEDYAFIVNGTATPDALVSGAAAFKDQAPILQVSQDDVPEVTEEAIGELGIEELYLVGGDAVISHEVELKLQNYTDEINRLEGEGRFDTSKNFAEEMFPEEHDIVVSGGFDENLADAIGACIYELPILYVRTNEIPEEVENYMRDIINCASKIKIMGGTAAVSEEVEDAIRQIIDDAAGGAVIEPEHVSFALDAPADVETNITWNLANEVEDVTGEGIEEANWDVDNDTFTISADFLEGFEDGDELEFVISFDRCDDVILTVEIVEEDYVESIEIVDEPDKLIYEAEEELDLTGMEVQLNWAVGGSEVVNYDHEDLTNDPAHGDELGLDDDEITVTHDPSGETAIQEITVVEEDYVESIEIVEEPDKLIYEAGEELDLTGMEVQLNWAVGGSEVVNYDHEDLTNDPAHGDELGLEDDEVLVTHDPSGETAIQEITVVEEEYVESIEIYLEPEKTIYEEGSELDLTGMYIQLNWAAAGEEIVEYDHEDLTNEPAHGDELGLEDDEVLVTHDPSGETAIQEITVVEEEHVESIEIVEEPETTAYLEEQDLDLTGMQVQLNWVVAGEEVVDYDHEDLTNEPAHGDELSVDDEVVTVTHDPSGETALQSITVVEEDYIESIEIVEEPETTAYLEGQDLDLTGMEVQLNWVVAEDEVLDYDHEELTNDPAHGDELGLEDDEVLVTHDPSEEETTQDIRVVDEDFVEEIEIVEEPETTAYLEGQDLDLTGMQVQLKWVVDEDEVVDYDHENLTNDPAHGDELGLEDDEIIVTHDPSGETDIQEILIEDEDFVWSIEIAEPPDEVAYIEGQDLDLSGMEVQLNWVDAGAELVDYDHEDLTNEPAHGDELHRDDTEVIVTYDPREETTEQEIMVLKPDHLNSMEIIEEPDATSYIEGSELDLTGMKVELDWVRQDDEILDYDDFSLTNEPAHGEELDLDDEEVIVTHDPTGETAIQEITVVEEDLVESIEIVTEPDKTRYEVGEELDLTGMEVQLNWEIVDEEIVDYDDERLTNEPAHGDELSLDDDWVEVTHDDSGETALQDITVVEDLDTYEVTFAEDAELEGVSIQVYADADRTEEVGDPVETGAEGEAVKELADGDYWFTASRYNYEDYEGDFEVEGEAETVEFEMKELDTYEVTFEEQEGLEDVSIQVYGDADRTEEVGDPVETGAEGEAVKELADGEYWFTAGLEGYEDYEGDFEVDGEAETVEFEMEGYEVTFKETNELEGVVIQVFADEDLTDPVGDPVETDEDGEAVKELPDGEYWFTAVLVEDEEYLDYEGDFEVDGEDKTVVFEMEEENDLE